MARHCEKCGAEIADDWTVCRSCFEPVKPEGFLTRLLRFLGVSRQGSGPFLFKSTTVVNTSETIKIRNAQTGEVREYASLEEVPVEYREQIRQAQQAARSGESTVPITVKDAYGEEHTYNSPDELPPELWAIYEKAFTRK